VILYQYLWNEAKLQQIPLSTSMNSKGERGIEAALISSFNSYAKKLVSMRDARIERNQLFGALKALIMNLPRTKESVIALMEMMTEYTYPPLEGGLYTDREKQMAITEVILDSVNSTSLICETGFNAGHSALLFLFLHPTVHVISFDLCEHFYCRLAEELLKELFPNRFKLIVGDSTRTLSTLVRRSKTRIQCDLVFIDGGHQGEVPLSDLTSFWQLGHPLQSDFTSSDRIRGAKVLMDDLACIPAEACIYTQEAWDSLKDAGHVQQTACYRGVTVGWCYGHFVYTRPTVNVT